MKPRSIFRSLAAAAALVGLLSCKTAASTTQSAASAPWQDFEDAWADYQDLFPDKHPYEIQERCQNIFAKPSGEPKGVAVFHHGFTACPMQFIPFVERMQALGYYVIVPLLPGQGRGPSPLTGNMKLKDDGKDVSYSSYYGRYLPTEPAQYQDYLREINRLVSKAPGRRVVAGLSGGGALATETVLLAEEQGLPDLYDAGLAMSPFYSMPGLYLGRKPSESVLGRLFNAIQRPVGDAIYFVQKVVVAGTESNALLADIPISFGSKCYESICGDRLPECRAKNPQLQVGGGRDAICDYKLTNINALQNLGESTQSRFLDLVDRGWIKTRFQIVGTELDSAADTAPMQTLGQALIDKAPDRGNYCLYAPVDGLKVPHVLFDLSEQPFAPMPWRKSFMDMAVTFLDGGSNFPTVAGKKNPNCTVPYR